MTALHRHIITIVTVHRAPSAPSCLCPAEPQAQAVGACRLVAAVALLLMGVAAVCGVVCGPAAGLADSVAVLWLADTDGDGDSGVAGDAPLAPGNERDERECCQDRVRVRSPSPSPSRTRAENFGGRKNVGRFVPAVPGPAQQDAGGGDVMGARLACMGVCAIVAEREPAVTGVRGVVTTRGPPTPTRSRG